MSMDQFKLKTLPNEMKDLGLKKIINSRKEEDSFHATIIYQHNNHNYLANVSYINGLNNLSKERVKKGIQTAIEGSLRRIRDMQLKRYTQDITELLISQMSIASKILEKDFSKESVQKEILAKKIQKMLKEDKTVSDILSILMREESVDINEYMDIVSGEQ